MILGCRQKEGLGEAEPEPDAARRSGPQNAAVRDRARKRAGKAGEAVGGGGKMRLKRALPCWVVIMLLGGAGTAVAQSDVFMCVEGVAGGSTDEQFADCSEILGVSYSVGVEGGAPPSPGGGSRSPKATCGLYVASKAVDISSVRILIDSLRGRHLSEVDFAVRTSGEEPLVIFELLLRDVLVVEVQQNLAAETESPIETIVLQPAEVTWRFTPQDDSGAAETPVEDGFDCVNNRRL
jgi:type VI secretion system secreted protein Hcp